MPDLGVLSSSNSLLVLQFHGGRGLGSQYVVFNRYGGRLGLPQVCMRVPNLDAYKRHIQKNRPLLNLWPIFAIGVGSPPQTVHVFMFPAQFTRGLPSP